MEGDCELMKLAAKAAGLHVSAEVWHDDDGLFVGKGDGDLRKWSPLTDDGDALRLAVMLGLAVIPYPIYSAPKDGVTAKLYRNSAAVYRGRAENIEEHEAYEGDPDAATRRAIVRAAAEIGRALHPPASTKP